MALKGHTPNALLGLLSFHPMSGYDMRKLIPESIGHFWSESYGQIYPALKSLTAEGLVSKQTTRSKGKPDRHIYALTDAGRTQLSAWLAVPVAPPVPRNELLLKLFFGAHAPPAASLDHVHACRAANLAAMDLYDSITRRLRQEQIDDPQLPFWLMTLSYGRHQCAATIAWCDETLQTLESLESLETTGPAKP